MKWRCSLSIALACAACGEPSRDVTYAERRFAPPLASEVLTLSDAERFGARAPQPPASPKESPLIWVGPPGWEERPPTSMRLANYRVGTEGECYLTVLGGSGGGVRGNVNRWRGQMGLGELSVEEVEALPKIALLGRDAYLLDLTGTYQGMGAEGREGWGLRGAILGSDQFTIFVKFTGPRENVMLEAGAFEAFCASIALHEHSSGARSESGSQVAGGSAGGISWDVPDGWEVGAERQMRLVTFNAGAVECYLSVLGGDGGGIVGNIQRWVGQLGLTPPTGGEVAALPTVEILGVVSPLLEATGEFSGMGAVQPTPDTTLLGTVCLLKDRAIFVKMLGPSAAVSAERGRFLDFVASMHLEEEER